MLPVGPVTVYAPNTLHFYWQGTIQAGYVVLRQLLLYKYFTYLDLHYTCIEFSILFIVKTDANIDKITELPGRLVQSGVSLTASQGATGSSTGSATYFRGDLS